MFLIDSNTQGMHSRDHFASCIWHWKCFAWRGTNIKLLKPISSFDILHNIECFNAYCPIHIVFHIDMIVWKTIPNQVSVFCHVPTSCILD